MTLLPIAMTPSRQVQAEQAIYSGTSWLSAFVLARNLGLEVFGRYAGLLLAAYFAMSISQALWMQPMQVSWSKWGATPGYVAWNVRGVTALAILLSAGGWTMEAAGLYAGWAGWGGMLEAGMVGYDFLRKLLITSGQTQELLRAGTVMLWGQLAVLALSFAPSANFSGVVSGMAAVYVLAAAAALPKGIFQTSHKDNVLFFRDAWQQSRWLLPTALIQWWSGNFFVLSAGLLISPAALGALRLAQSVFGVFNLLLQSYENLLTPQAARAWQTGSAAACIGQVSRRWLWPMAAAVVLTGAAAGPVLSYLGVSLEGDLQGQVFVGMALLYLLILINYPIRIHLRVSGRNDLFFKGYVLALLFSLLTVNPLLEHWQILGALIGLGGAQLLLTGFWATQIQIWKRP